MFTLGPRKLNFFFSSELYHVHAWTKKLNFFFASELIMFTLGPRKLNFFFSSELYHVHAWTKKLNFFFASELYPCSHLDPRGTSFIPKPIHASKQASKQSWYHVGPNKCANSG